MRPVGVLALQGAFREHKKALTQCGVKTLEVRKKEDIAAISALVIPGGESTTMGKLLVEWDIMEDIIARAKEGMPIFGTCAGMILLAKEIEGSDQPRVGLLNVAVKRNAFGRQVDSFEAELDVAGFDEPVLGVFIRAPYISAVGDGVEILAVHEKKIVMVRQKNLLACSFHPELTEDTRIHQFFINMI